jgi:hypothetical protein
VKQEEVITIVKVGCSEIDVLQTQLVVVHVLLAISSVVANVVHKQQSEILAITGRGAGLRLSIEHKASC